MHKFKTLRFVLIIALLAIAGSTVYGQDENVVVVPAGETIKVAVETSLTITIPEMGLDIEYGAEVVLAQLNEAGGIKGFEVEFIVEDDSCSSDEAALVANRIVSNPEIVAVIGPICSGSTVVASELFEEANIVMVTPSATADEVTARGLAVVNRTAPLDSIQGVVDANYLYKILGVTKLAVLHDNETYGLGLATTVKNTFEELGGEVVAFEGITAGDQDYRPVLSPFVASGPQAIFFGGYKEEAILLVPQKNDLGLEDVLFMGPDGIYAQPFIDGAGEAAEGVYASFVAPVPNEEFDQAYLEMHGMLPDENGPFHAQAADAASMVFQAIDAVSVLDDDGNLVIDRLALIEAVRNTADFEGLTGVLTCDETGDCGATAIGMNIVEDGAWVNLEVPEDLLEMEPM
jgi:branched-chain amino acid transport system substrate-binding protein